jgi:dipeptidyl-peptidase-3
VKRFWMMVLCAALGSIGFAQSPRRATASGTKKAPEPSSIVERIGRNGFVQVEAESFRDLSPRQKELAYWLAQASIAIEPIFYDQMSRFGLRQKRILEAVEAHPTGIKPDVMKKIDSFTKLFWANHGNHQDTTAQKFLPDFTFEELEAAGLRAIENGALLGTPDEFRKELADLKPSLFDPQFEPQTTAKSPRGGLDILQASSNNFYAVGVTLADMKNFQERYPLNSRVLKTGEGKLIEEVYRAGTPDGKLPEGLYATYLQTAIDSLRKARPLAEPGQADVIDALIRYYQTGDPQDWIRFGILWVGNNPAVDFANGFIEVYRDARGQKGTSQSFVSITDEKLNRMMLKIADAAQYFENRAPWADAYKKQGVKPPLAKAVETVVETGDFGVTTVGDNLPNENEIREKYGTKSFLYTGSQRTLNKARGYATLEEFAWSPEEKKIGRQYGFEANDLLTAMHEIIGHGSGKVSPTLTKAPETYLREYYSTLEEARADLVALWNVGDPKLKELGLVSNQEGIVRAMYYTALRTPLTQLVSIPRGDTIEEDHQRDRALIGNYIMETTGAARIVEHDGKHYVEVTDFQKARDGVGKLLAEIMRIKAEGDYEAIKALIDKYGVHFDPKLRDEVVARFQKLNLPTYWTGIHPDLAALRDAAGNVTSVSMSYPRDIRRQRLAWASMYEPGLRSEAKKSAKAAKK